MSLGGVRPGIADHAALGAAIAGIRDAVTAARPDAVIDGSEIQAEMTGCIEALVPVPPFGALTVICTGGMRAEIEGDRVVGLGGADRRPRR